MADSSAPTYRQLLQEAWEIGRLDGRFAAAFEPAGAPVGDVCLGRSSADLARLLWAGLPGTPPAGLEQNAPLWYASGFADGLAARRAEQRMDRLSHVRRICA